MTALTVSKRIRYLLLISMLLVAASLVATTTSNRASDVLLQPAEAATYEICNYSGSDDGILIYRISSPFQEWYVSPGNCATVNNSGGAARVDVDPSGGSADIDSWRKWRVSDNPYHYPCYNNEDGSSNPYDDEDNFYWTHAATNCAS